MGRSGRMTTPPAVGDLFQIKPFCAGTAAMIAYSGRVQPLRRLFRTRAPLIGWLLLVVLAVRLLVPGGYMTVASEGGLRLVACSGWQMPTPADHAMAMAGHGADHRPSGHGGVDHDRPEQPCAFAGLGHAAIGSADPAVLALAIAFAMLLAARAPAAAPRRATARAWPPAHGPPTRA